MSTLNIINKSPFEKRTLEQCLPRLGKGDAVLLIEDASVAAIDGNTYADALKEVASELSIYVLQPDLDARGLGEKTLVGGLQSVDYEGFVDLAAEHARVHSWL